MTDASDNSPEVVSLNARIKALERENRRLKKKLDRSEINRRRVEQTNDRKAYFLQTVIDELEVSQQVLEQRSQELEATLTHLNAVQGHLITSEKLSALGVLVAGIAHEINNPVSFIYGNLVHITTYTRDLLHLVACYQEEYPEPPPRIQQESEAIELDFLTEDFPKVVQSVQVGAERIKAIVQSLRTFARFDEAEYKPVDIHDGLESTLMILQTRLKATGKRPPVKVLKAYAPLPQVECFPGQLNQVFMNLLANAIDALESRWSSHHPPESEFVPTISIRTQAHPQKRVTIEIADNAGGMPEAVRERIFDPFFTTKPVGKGTGLGLSISHQIIEKHGGNLNCESDVGEGTTFTITLPL